MNLDYGTQYDALRERIRAFIAEHRELAPSDGGVDAPGGLEWQRLLVQHGFVARSIPVEFGGYGAEPDPLALRIITESFAREGLPCGINNQGISMLAPMLLELGDEAQKQQFIAPTIRGEIYWCQGYSEPNAGSDLASLTTRAHLDGDDWVINGQKIWTSGAHMADWMFCLVRTDPEATKHAGISFLLLKMDTLGIEVRPLPTMLVHAKGEAQFNEVFFTDVRVPATQMVSEPGQGWQVANAILKHERNMLGDPSVTLRRLHALVALMKRETLDGQRLIDNPVYRDRVMQLSARVQAMLLNDLRILSCELNGDDPGLAPMVVKWLGTELRHELEGLGIEIMGELGLLYPDAKYMRESSWQDYYMYFLGLIIGGGTSQIQKNIIGERGLGLPREPRQLERQK
ncbi:MAG: alkylation response protein AidB-like acyl-CoA dehydrogenase [Bermanella sp.]|jgi:alkylation response protein AidB-like acyl-CoA dehydrogenase